MEAALASGVLKVAGDKLVSLITSEFASITDVKKHLYELEGKRQDISRWLPVVGDRATEGGTPLQWVKDLRNVAYDIEDLLYEVHLEAEKHRIHSDSDEQPIAGCFCAKPKSFLFRCKVARKIEEIKLKYEKIVKQASDANKIRNNLQMDDPVPRRNRTAGELSMLSNVDDSKIPKRDQEKDKIVSMILESNEGGDGCIGIVSIIGLGGSGKTTLAKHICHDKMIIEHFNDAIFWVHVSQEFDVKKLICKLFQAVTKQKSDLHAEEHMFTEISNKLRSKKFLLVLDDAWCREKHDWEQFIVHLKNSPPGSKILLTTRDLKVAESVNSRNPFELELLTEDESWSLFLTSSKWVEKDLSSEYIQVGKEILNRCSGVPLAIRTIGGILCEKKEISIWRAIRGSDLWNVNSIEENVFSSLKLSFIHLSDELKQCFTFCSIFPKGYEIYKDRLIAQWVAHGFINAMNGVHPEIIGRGYFDSLLKVGFLQDPYEHWPSEQLVCKMHDLIHDLARLILQDEVVTYNMTANCTQRCRYLSLTSCADKVNRGSFGIGKVHAVFVSDSNPTFDKPVKKSSSVRSVVLDYTNNTLFPQFILKFEYIGYLEIHNLSCSKFPEALSGCWNLQSLHFISCNSLVTLPKSIGKLKKLRTLELIFANDLESLPQSIGDCRDLQSLHLHYCGKVSEIPSTICKIRNLRALHISNCSSLEQLPSEFTGEFSNLRTINLAYSQVTMLPQWVTTIATLKCINLRYCQELVELPEGVGNLKSLEVLDVEGCRKLGCMPSGIGQLTLLEKLGLFVVGSAEDDASISELGDLGKLRGGMQIRNLKYLKDPCDAEKACLKRKNKIQYLELYWSLSQAEVDLASDVEQQQAVLSALEPPSQIQNLEINGYRGLCFPWWMMEQNDSSCCEGITLEQTIPCQFLSLTKLRLCQILNLKHMRGLLKFPSLKSLELWEMTNLEELWTTTSGLEILEEEIRAEDCFPVLSELSIRCCPKLSTVKPYFPPSLEKMRLDKCNLLLLSSGNFSHLLPPPANQFTSPSSLHSDVPHLRVLRLERMTRPSSSGWEFLQHCTELETLCINGCDDLTQLPDSTRSLTSLQELCIYNCSTLCALPEWLGELCSLRELNVSGTPMISSLPQSIGHLTSLTRLEIGGCDNLKLLPDAIQHLASLEYLQLAYCHALAMLPECIGQLSALQRLYIRCCSTLECLPQSILHLTALQGLFIYNCPALARRYKQGVGSDWHLVSHVPHVTIRED